MVNHLFKKGTDLSNFRLIKDFCLFNWSIHAHTSIGPDRTRVKELPEPDFKSLYHSKQVNDFAFGHSETRKEKPTFIR